MITDRNLPYVFIKHINKCNANPHQFKPKIATKRLLIQESAMTKYLYTRLWHQEPLFLTWTNFNPSMDKLSHASKIWEEINYPFSNFNGCTIKSGEHVLLTEDQGTVSIYRLIFNTGIPLHGKDGLYIDTGPRQCEALCLQYVLGFWVRLALCCVLLWLGTGTYATILNTLYQQIRVNQTVNIVSTRLSGILTLYMQRSFRGR